MDKETKQEKLRELGARLKQLRKEAGYSNYENFAFTNEIPRAQYGRWERGEDDIRFSSLLKLSEAFGVSVSELLKGF